MPKTITGTYTATLLVFTGRVLTWQSCYTYIGTHYEVHDVRNIVHRTRKNIAFCVLTVGA